MRLNDWKTNPVRSRRRRVARSSDSWLIVWPSRMTSPLVGWSRPPRTCRRVDLPEPDGPMSATNSPGWTVQRDAAQRLDTGLAERYDFVRSRASRIAGASAGSVDGRGLGRRGHRRVRASLGCDLGGRPGRGGVCALR